MGIQNKQINKNKQRTNNQRIKKETKKMKRNRNNSFLWSADFSPLGIPFDCIFQDRKRIKLSKCVLIHKKKDCRDIHKTKLYSLNSNPKFSASSPNLQSPDSTNSELFRSVKKETHQIRRIKRQPPSENLHSPNCVRGAQSARGGSGLLLNRSLSGFSGPAVITGSDFPALIIPVARAVAPVTENGDLFSIGDVYKVRYNTFLQ